MSVSSRWTGPQTRGRAVHIVAACLVLAVVTVAVYAQVAGHQFLQFDDADYVTENPAVTAGLTWAGVRWAFATTHAGNWHPLTWLSHMADVQAFGLNAGSHLLVNVGLHVATSMLLAVLLFRLTRRSAESFCVAALFAIHPIHVESVAWVAERKDVLSTFWWALTIAAYVRYVQRPNPKRYALVMVLFALALLSKQMVVTLPLVLLLLDIWPLRRWQPNDGKGLIKEKLPLIALAGAAGIVTFAAQNSGGAVQSSDAFPWALRFANVPVAYVVYLTKIVWPSQLIALYPYPDVIPWWRVAGCLALVATITIWTFKNRRERPYLVVGWLWYLITLLPVIGLIQVGSQPYADRYLYVPAIGVFIMVVWTAADSSAATGFRRSLLGAIGALIIAVLALRTFSQVRVWHDSRSLWEHAVAVMPDNYRAHTNLGFALAEEHDTARALAAYREAIRIQPRFAPARNYYGALLLETGDPAAAASELRTALRIRPHFVLAHNNLGMALAALNQPADAISAFQEAVRLDPLFAPAWNNLGVALAGEGQLEPAISAFRESVRLQPGSAEAHLNLATALEDAGQLAEARAHREIAQRLR